MRYLAILLATIAVVYPIVRDTKWNEISFLEKSFTMIVIGAFMITAYYTAKDYVQDKSHDEGAARWGELQTDYTFKEVASVKIRDTGVEFFLRNKHSFWYDVGGQPCGFDLAIENKHLLANVTIRDLDGTEIAVVDGDYWKVYKDGYDYNNDNTAFEIVTPSKRVIFQIDLVQNVAYVAGLLMHEGKNGLYLAPAAGGAMIDVINNGQIKGINFQLPQTVSKIFRYPREKYFNERVDMSRYDVFMLKYLWPTIMGILSFGILTAWVWKATH